MRDIKLLTPQMQDKVAKLDAECRNRGLDMIWYCTLRSHQDQARAYRQSRGAKAIGWKIDKMRGEGYPELADIMESVGPVFGEIGNHITFAGPGESWHQYGEAIDGVPIVNGKLCWSATLYREEWAKFAEAIQAASLVGGYLFSDKPHAQMRAEHNPLNVLTRDEVLAAIK